MTVPSDPIQPAAQARPGTVTTSGYLLVAIGLLSFVGVATALASYPTIHSAFVDVYKGTAAEGSADAVALLTSGLTIATSVLFGIGALILAPLVLKGKQPARIITWVVAGLLICCQGGGLASSGLSGASFGQSGTTNGIDMQELQRRLVDDLPNWVRPTELAVGGIMVILGIVVVILLALPASHPFFRKQQAQWAPPAYPTV